jgi:methionyl-tRNA synthetase
MPKANKLLILKVDVGTDIRTIVSGIAEYFTAEEEIGKTVTVLTNLEPRNLRGVESKGMILLASTPDGKLTFVVPEEITFNGAVIS